MANARVTKGVFTFQYPQNCDTEGRTDGWQVIPGVRLP